MWDDPRLWRVLEQARAIQVRCFFARRPAAIKETKFARGRW